MSGAHADENVPDERPRLLAFFARLLGLPPRHDCRTWLPSPVPYPNGSLLHCPVCGVLNRRETYIGLGLNDDDVEYMTWRRSEVAEDRLLPGSPS